VSVVSEEVRAVLIARAEGRCEYCHLPTQGQIARFPVDHVLPRNSGGPTELDNLALACPWRNARKWAHTEGVDSVSGETVPLFNPRTQEWSEHFCWSPQQPLVLEGRTACGRGTIARLQRNHPDMIAVRGLLSALGLFPGDG